MMANGIVEATGYTYHEYKAMYDRGRELDRLYLLEDGYQREYLRALGAADLNAATRTEGLRRRYRRAYEQLRDSNIGLPEGYQG